MANEKNGKTKTVNKPPRFRDEAEEAEWLSTDAGQRFL